MERRTVAYCRVSTATQQSGLESQIRQIRDYCKITNIGDIEIFTDENQSGAKASRPGLDRMMAAVKNGEISAVIVPAFSRLARSTTHLLSALDTFQKHGTSFVSLSERLDTSTATGKMAFTVLAAVSQIERELIIERVRAGLHNAKMKGKHIGRVKTRPSEMIRALRASGLSVRECARLARTSHGSVNLELKVWADEAQKQGKTLKELIDEYNMRRPGSNRKTASAADNPQGIVPFPQSCTLTNGIELNLPADGQTVELEITR